MGGGTGGIGQKLEAQEEREWGSGERAELNGWLEMAFAPRDIY